MHHNLINEKLTELIEQIFDREGSLYLAWREKHAFITSKQPKRYIIGGHVRYFVTLPIIFKTINFISFNSNLLFTNG